VKPLVTSFAASVCFIYIYIYIYICTSRVTVTPKVWASAYQICFLFGMSRIQLEPETNTSLSFFVVSLGFFFLVSLGGVRLSPLGTSVTIWHIVPAPNGRCVWSIWWNENWQGKPKYSRKPAPVPLCPQIPHDLTWDRTRAAAMGSRRLTA
jgi:hypothetical protein